MRAPDISERGLYISCEVHLSRDLERMMTSGVCQVGSVYMCSEMFVPYKRATEEQLCSASNLQ